MVEVDLSAIIVDIAKAWGPPSLIAVILWAMLTKSEKREEAKDKRIQLLENLLIESYDERIEAADRISEAIHTSASATSNLTTKIDSLLVSRVIK